MIYQMRCCLGHAPRVGPEACATAFERVGDQEIVLELGAVGADNGAMDILAHGLWAGLGLRWLGRRQAPPRKAVVIATLAAAVLPDLAHLLPVIVWVLSGGAGLSALWQYALAVPGGEPGMPDWVAHAAHHLHCIFHSAPIALAATLLAWRWRAWVWLPLAGWWSHIVIDVFTHSAEFYPAPVLYPFSYQGFDGVAWNTPWFMALNYLALLGVTIANWRRR